LHATSTSHGISTARIYDNTAETGALALVEEALRDIDRRCFEDVLREDCGCRARLFRDDQSQIIVLGVASFDTSVCTTGEETFGISA